jgi:phage virion morphogenesis protein
MSDRLLIEIDDGEAVAMLRQAIDRLDHTEPLMWRIAALLENNVQMRFDQKVDPNGASWAQIKDSTSTAYKTQSHIKKMSGNYPGTLLERTREMRNSLESRAGQDWAEVGFGSIIAAFHETGTRKMERRGLLSGDPEMGTLGREDQVDIEREVADFLAGLL